ncbi:MAG: autoinducer binding domain-containing protein [Alphaproteobacteria bacterium]|nr:autoinducer binding domain-containing protein [Alphaproteobacteria bacterium]
MNLSDFVIESSDAETVEALQSALYKGLRDLCGVKYYIFGLETDHPHIGMKATHGLLTNYPQEWLTVFIKQKYGPLDAVVKYGLTSYGPFTWEDIPTDYFSSKRSRGWQRDNCEAYKVFGVCTPMRAPFGQIGGMGASNDSGKERMHAHHISTFNILSQQFYVRFLDICGAKNKHRKNLPHLTPREKDVMAWVARGKTNEEISDILSLSSNYVREIVSGVMTKYNAVNRVSAVLTAIFLGEIDVGELTERSFIKRRGARK